MQCYLHCNLERLNAWYAYKLLKEIEKFKYPKTFPVTFYTSLYVYNFVCVCANRMVYLLHTVLYSIDSTHRTCQKNMSSTVELRFCAKMS